MRQNNLSSVRILHLAVMFGIGCTHLPVTFATDIEIRPVAADGPHLIEGNEVFLASGGQRVFLEIFLSNWNPALDDTTLLKAWQADLDERSYTSGDQGTLAPATESCSDDRDCRVAWGGVCSFTGTACVDHSDCEFAPAEECGGPKCNYPLQIGGFCSPGFILSGRDDYIYLGNNDLRAVDLSTLRFRFASSIVDAPGTSDTGEAKYAGTIALDVPADAEGTFRIGTTRMGMVSSQLPFFTSILVDQNNNILYGTRQFPAFITIGDPCDRPSACNDNDACSTDQCGCLDQDCLPSQVCTNVDNFDPLQFACVRSDGTLCDLPNGWWGDFDGDDNVNLRDYQLLQSCFGSIATGECDRVIMDDRCDVELPDHSEFSQVLTGPIVTP